MPNATNCGATPVLALELDRNGNVSKKTMKLDREAQLTNSLLQGLYPGIHVATVDVPTEPLDSCEQAMVEQALTRIGEELRNQYTLTYRPNNLDTFGFHTIQVTVSRRDLETRFRPGYVLAPQIQKSPTSPTPASNPPAKQNPDAPTP